MDYPATDEEREEVLEAIRDGVRSAFTDMIGHSPYYTNREAILTMIEEGVKKAFDENMAGIARIIADRQSRD